MPEEKPQPQAPYYQQQPSLQPAGAANAANGGAAPAAAAGPASLVQDSSYLNHHF